MKAQQTQNQAAIMMQQRMGMKGTSILALLTFAEHLSNFTVRRTLSQHANAYRDCANLITEPRRGSGFAVLASICR